MVTFTPVDPASLKTERLGRRGRISYPLLKSFLEANVKLAKLDLTGLSKNPNYLRSVLTSYIKSHKLPIKLFAANGDLHLMRLDLNNDGTPIPNWKPDTDVATEGYGGLERDTPATPLTDDEVDRRFHAELPQSLK